MNPSNPSHDKRLGPRTRLVHVPSRTGTPLLRTFNPFTGTLLGEIPGVKGLHVCAGFSGMGFKISPAIGLVMSELVLDGKGQSVDLHPFRPNRFAEGQPIKAEFEYVDD